MDGRRDHSFRVPRPDLSAKLGTPDACTDCHRDRSPEWAAGAVARWYGPGRRSGWHYAEALHAGQTARADAASQLVRAAQDPVVPPIARATALALLARHVGPGASSAIQASLGDPDPLVRRAATGALVAVEPARRVALALPLLGDPIRSVRFEALSALLDVPRRDFTPEQLAALAQYARAAGDLTAARAWAQNLVALSPGDPAAQRLLESLEGR